MNYSIEHREENLSQIKEQIKEICKNTHCIKMHKKCRIYT